MTKWTVVTKTRKKKDYESDSALGAIEAAKEDPYCSERYGVEVETVREAYSEDDEFNISPVAVLKEV